MRFFTIPLVLLLAGCGVGDSPQHPDLHGTLTLGFGAEMLGKTCAGKGGYSDINEGAAVVVTDQDGRIVGTGSLSAGAPAGSRVGFTAARCEFTFTIPGRLNEQFLGVEVSHRGRQTYSRAQLDAASWDVRLTLGTT